MQRECSEKTVLMRTAHAVQRISPCSAGEQHRHVVSSTASNAVSQGLRADLNVLLEKSRKVSRGGTLHARRVRLAGSPFCHVPFVAREG